MNTYIFVWTVLENEVNISYCVDKTKEVIEVNFFLCLKLVRATFSLKTFYVNFFFILVAEWS